MIRLSLVLLFLSLCVTLLAAGPPPQAAAQHGYTLLVDKPYLPPDLDQETFDAVWKQWPEPLRSQA